MREPHEHAEDRNLVETILRRIPGFRGYLEKEYRRQSDELQRQWLADRLQRSKGALDAAARALVDQSQIDLLPQIDRIRSRLDKVIWQIRSAMQGYSGVFDLVRIREAELERIYEHDVGLMDEVDTLAEAIEALPSEAERLAEVLPEILNRLDDLESRWEVRGDMLKGLE